MVNGLALKHFDIYILQDLLSHIYVLIATMDRPSVSILVIGCQGMSYPFFVHWQLLVRSEVRYMTSLDHFF